VSRGSWAKRLDSKDAGKALQELPCQTLAFNVRVFVLRLFVLSKSPCRMTAALLAPAIGAGCHPLSRGHGFLEQGPWFP
jgi:hypothetical protein